MKMPAPENPVVLICSPYLSLTGKASIWQAASQAGVDNVELLVNHDLTCPDLEKDPSLTCSIRTVEAGNQIKKQAMECGVKVELFVAPLHLKAGMSYAPGWAHSLLETAGSAGARQVSFPLVTDNFLVPEIPDQDYIDSALHVFSSLVEASGRTGIRVLFENLSVYLNRPEILERILNEFTREELGFCLDPVNLCWYGHTGSEVYRMAEKLAPRASGLHIKNIKYPAGKLEIRREPGWRYDELVVPADQGDLDFSRLTGFFKDSGFTGYYGIEDDSLNLAAEPERLGILRSSVDYVKGILGLTATPELRTVK